MQAAVKQNDISAASAWHRLCPAFWSAPWELRQGRLCLSFVRSPGRRREESVLLQKRGWKVCPASVLHEFSSFALHLPPEGFVAWIASLPACWPQGAEKGMGRTLHGEGQHLLGAHITLSLVFSPTISKTMLELCCWILELFSARTFGQPESQSHFKDHQTSAEKAPRPSAGQCRAGKHHQGLKEQQLWIIQLICARNWVNNNVVLRVMLNVPWMLIFFLYNLACWALPSLEFLPDGIAKVRERKLSLPSARC